MRTIAIINQKGGVAKTTTAINVAAILASDHKQRVLLVDADSQCNATEFFGGDPANGNLAEALRTDRDDGFFAAACIQPTNFPGVDLLAGDDSLMDLDLSQVQAMGVNTAVLCELSTLLEIRGHYDYMLIDCPPAFNAASAAALMAADAVIIPIKLDAFSLRGMINLTRQISNMQRLNPALQIAGCLLTMWYASDEISAAEKTLRDSRIPVFRQVIRRSDKVDGMTFAQAPLAVYSPRSAAGVDYRRFVAELMGGVRRG